MHIQAEVQSQRCQQQLRAIQVKIRLDNQHRMLLESDRRALRAELHQLEEDFVLWGQAYSSRSEEKRDIQTGIREQSLIHVVYN